MDRYYVVVVNRHDGTTGSLGPYVGDQGADQADEVSKAWTDKDSKAVVVGV